MRSFWNERAREDAFYFVDTRQPYRAADRERFWDAEELVDYLLGGLGVQLAPGGVVLEIGCGIGRITRVLAARSREVLAVDVSDEMLARAREHNRHLTNVRWILGDGVSLTGIPAASVDSCVSVVVLQHIPDPEVTLGYVARGGSGAAARWLGGAPGLQRSGHPPPAAAARTPAARRWWAGRPAASVTPRGSALPSSCPRSPPPRGRPAPRSSACGARAASTVRCCCAGVTSPLRSPPVWTWRRGLLLIAAVAGAARLALILASLHFTLFGDPADYERHAHSIAAGHGFPATIVASAGTPSAFRPPGYPYALGALYAVLGQHPQAGRALSALLGVIAVVLLAYLARALWDQRTGLLAGAIAAVFPPLVDLNASLLSEALFVPLELGFALALVALARRPQTLGWALAAGALAALAALTRSVADAWVLVAVAVAAFAAGVRGRSRWLAGAAVALAFGAALAPWTVRNLERLHAFVPVTTESGFTLAGQYNPQAGADDGYEAVWRLPFEVPQIDAALRPLYRRRGGVDEVQLDAALRRAGLRLPRTSPRPPGRGHGPGHPAPARSRDCARLRHRARLPGDGDPRLA